VKIGAENRKELWALGVLGVVAAYFLYTNVLSNSGPAPTPAAKPAVSEASPPPPAETASAPQQVRKASTSTLRARSEEFRPVFRSKRPEDRVDPHSIDPTLQLDRFTKVQAVALPTATRNLFQFGAAPPPPKPTSPEPIVKPTVAKAYVYPQPDRPKVTPPPPPPPPEPPIDVKYYGVATKKIDGRKTAFFLDPENNIILAPEGGMIRRKYRVVQIGLTSVLVENVENKKQQTVQLAEDAGASMGN
jgi:hypothetical protein